MHLPEKKRKLAMGVGILSVLLMSCQNPPTNDYAYLMSHPVALQQALKNCQPNNFENPGCGIVQQAANDFAGLVGEQEQDPIDFGKKILSAQLYLVDLQDRLQKTTSSAETQTIKQSYQKQKEQVDAMLAVVAMHSPE